VETERKALAAADVSEELEGDILEREFAQLETGGDVDVEERLLALKRDMGLLAPAAEEGPKALEAGEAEEGEAEEVEAEEVEAEILDEESEGEAEPGEEDDESR
jgi:hypothetical protein